MVLIYDLNDYYKTITVLGASFSHLSKQIEKQPYPVFSYRICLVNIVHYLNEFILTTSGHGKLFVNYRYIDKCIIPNGRNVMSTTL